MRRDTGHPGGSGRFGSQEKLQPKARNLRIFTTEMRQHGYSPGVWRSISIERTYHACLVEVHPVDKEKPLAIQSPSVIRLAAVLRDVVWPADLALDRCAAQTLPSRHQENFDFCCVNNDTALASEQ